MAIYLQDALYVDWKTLEVRNVNIEVEEGVDGQIKFIDKIPETAERVLNCKGKLVTKSFGCAHHHIYSELARGMPQSKYQPNNFHEILKYVWWNLDKNLDLEMVEASALSCAIECAKNGVTFVIDHHASPYHVTGSLDVIRKAFDRIGISSLLCYELSDRDGEKSAKQGLEETDSFLSSGNQGLVGLHASFTVGDTLLSNAVKIMEKHDSGIHVHVAEDLIDQIECVKKYNKRVVERFNDFGFLDSAKTILAHCLHLDKAERTILNNSKSWIVQNAESNLNNKVGSFNSAGLNDNLLLGTDGMHSDMLRCVKATYFINQQIDGVSVPDIYRRFRNISEYLSSNNFNGDSSNNLVVLDYFQPTNINEDNFFGHFLFGINSADVESVISCGKLIVDNRKLVNVDENQVSAFSKEMSEKLWEKL